ncbi:hypothetical protein RCL1_001295 [Eukaryota sp. TZLM3-RCL]
MSSPTDHCIARLELFPNDFRFVIAKVASHQGQILTLVDEEPEDDQVNTTFTTHVDDVIFWPPQPNFVDREWKQGERVLSLVVLDDDENSTQFYYATIEDVRPMGEPVLTVRYEDDGEVQDVPIEFVLPLNEAQQPLKPTVSRVEPPTEQQLPQNTDVTVSEKLPQQPTAPVTGWGMGTPAL